MDSEYPLIGFKNDCFQEFKDEISLVLWCYNCNWHCKWCSLKSIIYKKSNIINIDYLDVIKNHTEIETAVVFLGGEPTLYPQGLIDGCKLSRELNLKTKIYTNGTNLDILLYLIKEKILDAVSIDYKFYSFNIEDILNELLNFDIDIDIRITKYPEITKFDLMKQKIEKEYPEVNLYIQKFQEF